MSRHFDAYVIYGFKVEEPDFDPESWLERFYPELTAFDHGTDSGLTKLVGVKLAGLEGVNHFALKPAPIDLTVSADVIFRVNAAKDDLGRECVPCGKTGFWLIGSAI